MTPHFSFNIEELNCVNEFVFYAGKILAIEFVLLKQVNLCVAKNCIVAPTWQNLLSPWMKVLAFLNLATFTTVDFFMTNPLVQSVIQDLALMKS